VSGIQAYREKVKNSAEQKILMPVQGKLGNFE
jgi:hypothetical protein